MDHQFPPQLFPAYYNCGPPGPERYPCDGAWGSYDQLRPQFQADPGSGSGSGPGSRSRSGCSFTPRRQVSGEAWHQKEPLPLPLLPPKPAFVLPLKPPDPMDFTQHMQNFYQDHYQEAFGCMGGVLGEHLYPDHGSTKATSVPMWQNKFLELLPYQTCRKTYRTLPVDLMSRMLFDVVHSVPVDLLGSLLYDELSEQRDRRLFFDGATGGALDYIPLTGESGCLVYPGAQGLDRLHFQQVELQLLGGASTPSSISTRKPISFQLQGAVRQISSSSILDQSCVAVRSQYLCGVWRLSQSAEPRLLQAVTCREEATGVSVSPHVLGEVLVATESGSVDLWTVGRGMQKVRAEDSNLYFNAKSPWRWCEFSAHPRVMLYADRTGAELTDMRVQPTSCHTLFRISKASECRSGERLILSRYLRDVHPFHHLVTTQRSAYIVDERFPCVPMLKWDHMMQSPPIFCHIVPGSAPSTPHTKVLLGSQSSQEITLLQYSGGRSEACSSAGPPLVLLRPTDSLQQLPVQIPHRHDSASRRLATPAAGLTCLQRKGGGAQQHLCVLQLTEAGDIFYQILENDACLRPDETRRRTVAAAAELLVSDTTSDEDVIGPTQVDRFVPETPERHRPSSATTDSEGSGPEGRGRGPTVQVVVNEDPDPSHVTSGPADKGAGLASVATLSDGALRVWRRWLQKMVLLGHKKNRKKKMPRPQNLPHFSICSSGILQLSVNQEKEEEDEKAEQVQSLRQSLKAAMSERSMLVAVPQEAPALVPLPDGVSRERWEDQLSNRLTTSWEGKEAWRSWWKEFLGLNREEKVAALKRKRRREKEARRAAGQRLQLSGSFTSSISYQSELSDFSDSIRSESGWSQGVSTDTEGAEPDNTSWAKSPSSARADTPTTSARPVAEGHLTPNRPRLPSLTPSQSNTPANQKRRRTDDYLSSLTGEQAAASQLHSWYPEVLTPPLVSLSQPVRPTPRAGPSQDAVPRSQPRPQSALQRLALALQPKKKKSQMGF